MRFYKTDAQAGAGLFSELIQKMIENAKIPTILRIFSSRRGLKAFNAFSEEKRNNIC